MDSENLTGALRVYERAGMRAVRQSVFYEKELRAGTDLATRQLPSQREDESARGSSSAPAES
jgi:hypothetical protein